MVVLSAASVQEVGAVGVAWRWVADGARAFILGVDGDAETIARILVFEIIAREVRALAVAFITIEGIGYGRCGKERSEERESENAKARHDGSSDWGALVLWSLRWRWEMRCIDLDMID